MTIRSVFCLAASCDQAGQIITELTGANVSPADISVLLLDHSGGGSDPAPIPAALADPVAAPAPDPVGDSALRNSLAGLGPLLIPGFPPLLVAGPLAAALNATPMGGIAGGLVDFGVPELEAARYESKIRAGGVLVSLRAENPDQTDRGRTIFRAAGAEDIRTIMVIHNRSGLRPPPLDGFASPALRRSRPSRRDQKLGSRTTTV